VWTTSHWNARIKTADGTAWQVISPGAYGYMGYGLTTGGYYWFSSTQTDHNGPHDGTHPDITPHMTLLTGAANQSILKVYGSILTREVTVSTTWSDYVFDKNYHLLTLPEVSKFIEENHHLPGIPSAKVIEEGGLNVGELQAKQMAKIEELTLYIINLERRLTELEKTK
jgi:hypothetical protein